MFFFTFLLYALAILFFLVIVLWTVAEVIHVLIEIVFSTAGRRAGNPAPGMLKRIRHAAGFSVPLLMCALLGGWSAGRDSPTLKVLGGGVAVLGFVVVLWCFPAGNRRKLKRRLFSSGYGHRIW